MKANDDQEIIQVAVLKTDRHFHHSFHQSIMVDRTKDVYNGQVSTPEIEDIPRDTLLTIAKEQCGWDAIAVTQAQEKRPIVNVLESVAKKDFSKYKLAKAFIRWAREHDLNNLQAAEIARAEKLIEKVNKALQ